MDDQPQADTRRRLAQLGAERLAAALAEFAALHAAGEKLVQRLLASPAENQRRFKTALAALKRSKGFYDYDGNQPDVPAKLADVLHTLRLSVSDARAGVEAVLGHCEDYDGDITAIYETGAAELFAAYAADCDDKAWLVGRLFDFLQRDEFEVRNSVLDAAEKFLPEPTARRLIEKFQARLEDTDADSRWQTRRDIQKLARAIKDAKLFEKTCLADNPGLKNHHTVAIS